MSEKSTQRLRAEGKFLHLGEARHFIKGFTYGPFNAGDATHGLTPEDQFLRDLDDIRDLGANAVRLYKTPTDAFVNACAERDIHILLSISWAYHIDFMQNRRMLRDLMETVKSTVGRFEGNPTIASYFVGNEIDATMVRWLGAARVKAVLEEMIGVGRTVDDSVLFAYSNYPSTEYLNPESSDFLAYNVYLEDREAYSNYLYRLQNIAADKPLLISEFGMDTQRNGEATQATTLGWQFEETVKAGASGNIVFAYTDEWFTAEEDVEDWDFGIVTRDRTPKPAHAVLGNRYKRGTGIESFTNQSPKVSVIVCTYNGTRTLKECLESLVVLDYENYEVLVIDDGSTADIESIAKEFPTVRYIRKEHAGLSAARNFGAEEATGDVLAYTDDDCIVHTEWLRFLVYGLESLGCAAIGGPNIPPPPQNTAQACVISAPGAPAHVLLEDQVAEHLPGCNFAVTRKAFDSIEGFRDRYRTAGDDVDFCWRLQDKGHVIGFHPAAAVWHFRRFRVRDYFKQQIGYGKAEALLMGEHAERFGVLGGAQWRGLVYQGGPARFFNLGGFRIYRGVFGYAPFQSIYAPPYSDFATIVTSFLWVAAAVILLLAGIWKPISLGIGAAMCASTLGVAIARAFRRPIDRRFDGVRARLLLVFLMVSQPLLRGATRTVGGILQGAFPRGPLLGGSLGTLPRFGFWKRVGQQLLWHIQGGDRDMLLTGIRSTLESRSIKHVVDNGWKNWDLELRRCRWWLIRLTTVTEYHEGKHRLTRVRFATRPTALNVIASTLLFGAIVLFGVLYSWRVEWIWGFGLNFLWWTAMEVRHQGLVREMADLVFHVGRKFGFREYPAEEGKKWDDASNSGKKK